MRHPYPLLFSLLVVLVASACSTSNRSAEELASDSLLVTTGREIFNQNCIACHSADRDGIGPALGGITKVVSADWLKAFIRNPQQIIDQGDERAVRLHQQFKSVMPSYDFYQDEQLDGIVAYLHTLDAGAQNVVEAGSDRALEDPIPEGIPMSDLVIEMEHVATMPFTSDEPNLRTRITKYFQRPDTRDLLVLDLRGKLYRLNPNGDTDVFLDMAEHMPAFFHRPGHGNGFGSFAFHPEFASNGLLYTTHTETPGNVAADFAYDDSLNVRLQWVLSEWKTDNPKGFPFEGTQREIVRINMYAQSHGVQEITFNPLSKPGDEDYGLLYIGIGDGGSAERGILHINEGPETLWSSIIRIDPRGNNSANGKYGIPAGNPFATSENPRALGEVYAYGFRNPHKISWTESGKMLVSNIGQHGIEELEWIRPGHNYGWPHREGRFEIRLRESTRNLYPLPADDASYGITYSVAEYDHDEGNAIIGGYEYTGSKIPELRGKYLFGDMVNGRLFFVEVADIVPGKPAPMKEWRVSVNGQLTSFKELCNNEARLSMRFGRDLDGEIYISTMPDGKVYRLGG